MNVKSSILRRFARRPRRSDRSIALQALLTALAAQTVFWCSFSYRRPLPAMRYQGAPVSLLANSEMTPELRRWLDRHDPANMVRSSFRGGYSAQLPEPSLRISASPTPPAPSVAPPAPEPRPFRALDAGNAAPAVRIPAAAAAHPVEKAPAVPAVTDENGRALPFDDVRLPFRSAAVQGDTVLRVVKLGGLSTAVLERSCGDPELDRFAVGLPLGRLSELEREPEYVILRWPLRPATGEGAK